MAYDQTFISGFEVKFPSLPEELKKQYKLNELNIDKYYLPYNNYTVLQNPFRRLPYFSAANIDGDKFKRGLDRLEDFEKDPNIPLHHQFGKELYNAEKSNFDRGHMTKREDVQWGATGIEAKKAADSTFYFTNVAPQHASLNRGIWKRIENYILKSNSVAHNLKVIVFTGPVLNENDPYFVTLVENSKIKIPRIFWKVVYYLNNTEELSRVAFITNQSNLLLRDEIVEPNSEIYRSAKGEDDYFLDFKDADTYQTNVSVIESLTLFDFPHGKDVYKDDRIVRLILEEVDYRSSQVFQSESINDLPKVKNLKL